MRTNAVALTTLASLLFGSASVAAASLQVTPISMEVQAPAAASTLTLNNPGATRLKAQIRVFRWSLVDGQEKLEPTADAIASPPIATLEPKTDYVVRIVRTSKAPLAVEESYRLVVDEIPDKSAHVPGFVTMAFRYSVPVFFTAQQPASPELKWDIRQQGGKTYVSATNTGTRRLRIADLMIADAKGKTVTIAKGLAGYVLARSSKSWVASGIVQSAGSPVLITAQGDLGPINARAVSEAAR